MGRMIEIDRREAELMHDLLIADAHDESIELANYLGEHFGFAPVEVVSVQ